MEIDKFIASREFLYHLTDRGNLSNILNRGEILSAVQIVSMSNIENPNRFLSTKRDTHTKISIDGVTFSIRDQQPISETVLTRSLEEGCSYSQFLYLLNSMVFFWPSINRLNRHFKRYQHENPVIIKLRTEDVFIENESPFFSKYNSGATRCSSHWDGNAPERGFSTFKRAVDYEGIPSSVAEVTFKTRCILPNNIFIGNSPDSKFQRI